MTGYTILTHEQYSQLLKSNLDCLAEKNILQQNNMALKEELQFVKGWLKIFKNQIKAEKSQNLLLLAHFRLQSQKLHQSHANLTKSTEAITELKSQLDKFLLKIQSNQHQITTFQKQNIQLSQRISELQNRLSSTGQEALQLRANRQRLQSDIRQLENRIKQDRLQHSRVLKQLNLKVENEKSLNQVLNQEAQQLKSITNQYEQTKEQNEHYKHQIKLLSGQLEKYKQSSIQKLHKQLQAKESWIVELTTTIEKLKQRCVELEMKIYPHNYKQNHILPNTGMAFLINHRQKQQEQYRIKYVTICKDLAKEFKAKLSKINNQKKLIQQKYQTVRVKLNQHQYNEFRYKDRINQYLQKIERFQKLTIKQQQEMQKLISQFDSELDNIMKKKQHQVKMKFQLEIERYQLELEKFKEHPQDKGDELQQAKRYQLLSEKDYQSDNREKSDNNCDEKDQNREQCFYKEIQNANYQDQLNAEAPFQHQLLQLQMQKLKIQFNQKYQLNELLNKQNRSLKKKIDKIQHSKNIYQQKLAHSEEQCYQKSTQLRRYKALLQELYRQLEIKTNQLETLKKQWIKISGAHYCSPSNSLNHNEEINNQSLIARFSSGENNQNQNRRHTPRQQNSSQYEYQESEIDTEGQLRNEAVLDNLIVGRITCSNNIFRKNHNQQHMAGISISRNGDKMHKINQGPRDYINSGANQALLQSSTHTIQMSSSGSSLPPYTNSPNSSSFSSSSKNSYQSFGIKNLYHDKPIDNSKSLLLHQNTFC